MPTNKPVGQQQEPAASGDSSWKWRRNPLFSALVLFVWFVIWLISGTRGGSEGTPSPTAMPRATATTSVAQFAATASVQRALPALAPTPTGLRMYGPAGGTFIQAAAIAKTYGVPQGLSDFAVRCVFYNPDAPRGGTPGAWDYGFLFRDAGGEGYRLWVDHTRQWRLELLVMVDGKPQTRLIRSGMTPSLATQPGAANELQVRASNTTGYLRVNGDLTDVLGLWERRSDGGVGVATGFAPENSVAGRVVRYEGFSVWTR